ncbi:hypothetical protein [Corynebacterium bovis]|uniref:hypothetical protein n=1 Tax=Corynebacterium bovis TaxID=36808 RepID=UPI000F640D4D|nr:hypothetical protein [Corynebacterium bovis]
MKNTNRLAPRKPMGSGKPKMGDPTGDVTPPSVNEAFTNASPKRKALTVRLTEDDLRRFAIARAMTGDTAQNILEQAIKQYIASIVDDKMS